jgi:DNA-directed RNA polymerase subunit D
MALRKRVAEGVGGCNYMMKVKLLKKEEPLRLKFVLSGANFEFANSLRRAMIADIPVMAIEDVNITANNSALYDEIISLRLGLIPLKTDLKGYQRRSDCKCRGKGCTKCTVKLTLEKNGPVMVYARDLKSSNPKVVPAIPDIPIVKLFDNQSIKLEAVAELGFGWEHTKWTSCMANYRYYPSVKVLKNCREAESVCPKKVFEFKANKLVVKNLEACDLCLACVEDCGEKSIRVSGDDTKFIFDVESWGQHDPKRLLKLGLQALSNRIDDFSKSFK